MKKRKNEIMDFIKAYMLKNQYPPTIREIGEGVGLKSPATVKTYMDSLVEDGLITISASTPRSIQVPGIEYREV